MRPLCARTVSNPQSGSNGEPGDPSELRRKNVANQFENLCNKFESLDVELYKQRYVDLKYKSEANDGNTNGGDITGGGTNGGGSNLSVDVEILKNLDARLSDLELGRGADHHQWGTWKAYYGPFTQETRGCLGITRGSQLSYTTDVAAGKKYGLPLKMFVIDYSVDPLGRESWRDYSCVILLSDRFRMYYYDRSKCKYVGYLDLSDGEFYVATDAEIVGFGAPPVATFDQDMIAVPGANKVVRDLDQDSYQTFSQTFQYLPSDKIRELNELYDQVTREE